MRPLLLARRGDIADSMTPPSIPSSGVLRDSFTDFFTKWGYSPQLPNGQIFQNRYKTGNLQTLGATPTPWSTLGGPAITEVLDPSGRPGFRFIANTETDMDYPASGSNKKVEIYEYNGADGHVNPNGFSMIRGLGYTDEISFYIRFPQSGNLSGFPGPNEGVWEYRNIFWQHSMDAAGKLILLGVSRLGFTNRFFLAFRDSFNNVNWGPYRIITEWDVAFDTEYRFHYYVKWANDSTGIYRLWIKRPTDSAEIQYVNHTGSTWLSEPNTEFGFYTAKAFSNEVIISDIRVMVH